MKRLYLLFIAALFTAGCGTDVESAKPKEAPGKKQPSVVREAINGFTGKTAVDQLKNAKQKITPANERGKQSKEEIDLLTKP